MAGAETRSSTPQEIIQLLETLAENSKLAASIRPEIEELFPNKWWTVHEGYTLLASSREDLILVIDAVHWPKSHLEIQNPIYG